MRHHSLSKLIAIFVAAAATLVFVIPGLPQSTSQQPPASPAAQTPAPPTPTVRVSTRLVQVNVIAQDHDEKPVLGLTKEDFVVTDQGHPQKIEFFSLQQNTTAVVEMAVAPPTVAPGTHLFSNRLAERKGVQPNVTVILLDQLNTHSTDMPYARKQVQKFIAEQLRPEDRVALYSMNGRGLTILHDFTTDVSELLAAVARDPNHEDFRTSASEPEPTDSGDSTLDAAVDASNARMAQFYMDDRVEKTELALKTIADHIGGLPGRKNLVWVSASFPADIIGGELPLDHHPYADDIENTARALNDANIAIYPIDARGLIANPNMARMSGPPARGASMFPSQMNFATMNTLAERTGGRAYYNSNDIHGAVRRAIDDSRVTYVLGYYPDGNWDSKFHDIKVQVKKSGVHLNYRKGYFAIPQTTPTAHQKSAMMREAIWSPLEATELGLNVEVTPIDIPGLRQLKLRVIVSPEQMRFTHDGDRWTDELDVVWVVADARGTALAQTPQPWRISMPQAAYEKVMRDGLSFSGTIDIADAATEVRVVARDKGTGAIGSVLVPLGRLFAPVKLTSK
ncbi:MAG TPA: VWA domain-containing protein [Candidatus Acidoferrales bacterium]|jgi:VWFA-related protein|nr:VWA domain-containing protein [Candidatus Acidoferrales bacterium]